MPYSSKQYLQELTKEQQLDIMKTDFFSNRELKIIDEENAYILPPLASDEGSAWFIGGVLNKNKEYIDESGLYAYGEKTRVYGKYEFNEENVKYIDKEVIYFNYYLNQWGHYLIEVIGRLWYALENPDYKIVYTIPLNGDNFIIGNFMELLKLAGISEKRLIRINEVTQFKRVIIPETSVLITKYWTKEYKTIINTIINNALVGCYITEKRKVYCSRRHFSEAKELGEDSVEQVFKNNDYEIVYMEKLSLKEQICLLNNCKEVVCVSGTLVHNCMFIRNKNCHVVVLNKTYKINQNIYLTNQLSNATFTFIDIYLSPLPVSIGKGPFIITITNELIKYCNDNGLVANNVQKKISIKKLIKYYVLYIKKYRKKIITRKKISNSGFEQYEVTKKEIRNHYKKQLRLLNGE